MRGGKLYSHNMRACGKAVISYTQYCDLDLLCVHCPSVSYVNCRFMAEVRHYLQHAMKLIPQSQHRMKYSPICVAAMSKDCSSEFPILKPKGRFPLVYIRLRPSRISFFRSVFAVPQSQLKCLKG